MNFWEQQAQAQRRTRWLVALFAASVAATVFAVDVIIVAVLTLLDGNGVNAADPIPAAGHTRAAFVSTVLVLAVIAIASLYRTTALRGGGGVVARSLGGVRVPHDSQDPAHRRLLNVVEEMSIASGVPVPAVYVLEQEDGINAFSAGHSPANAAIAITRGALDNLTRQELQGVMGHEFSHILNGDMRLNIRMMGLLFGLLMVAVVGRTVFRNSPGRVTGRRSEGAGAVIAAAWAVTAIGYVGVFFGRLIQAAVCRQREMLADASAVQFSRDPGGLRDALIRIGSKRGSHMRHPGAEEAAHMFFAPGVARWLATHPPLARRIRALDPSFDAHKFGDLKLEVRPQPLGVLEVVNQGELPHALRAADPAHPRAVVTMPSLVGMVGNSGAASLARAAELRRALPSRPGLAAQPLAAAGLLLALVLDPKPATRALQIARVREHLGEAGVESAEREARAIGAAPVHLRLPMLGQTFASLRQLPRETRWTILECLSSLIRVDGKIEVFEYALAVLARVYVQDALEPARQPRGIRLAQATVELQTLFAVLAEQGNADPGAAQTAYEVGMQRVIPGRAFPYRPVPGWAAALDRALNCLDRLSSADKALVVDGLAATVAVDGTISINEAELLRAICATLHRPLPPLGGDTTAEH